MSKLEQKLAKKKDKKIENKIIAIVGTNASGKTGLGVYLASKFNGEIVSADSRQVFRGMDIGTGKDLNEYKVGKKIIPYHLIDVIDPKEEFSLAQYQKLAYKAIDDILKRGKLPIIVGGTGLYAQAIVDEYDLAAIKPDKKLRQELEKMNADKLFKKLRELKFDFAEKLNESDKKNKRRLIRYLEIIKGSSEEAGFTKGSSTFHGKYNTLLIGLTWSREILHKKIQKRLLERLDNKDMIREVKRLHQQGISWQRLEDFGLEYKFIAQYWQDKLDYDEMKEKLFRAIKQFAKRQMTWLRRWERQGAKIHWIKNRGEAENLVKTFLK